MKVTTHIRSCTEIYRGSVKRVFQVVAPGKGRSGTYLFKFTDDYSVFDYGKMPDRIRGKGAALAVMAAYLFEQIENPTRWKRLVRSLTWEKLGGARAREILTRTPLGTRVLNEGLRTHYRGIVDRTGNVVTTECLDTPSTEILVEAVPVISPECASISKRVVWNYNVFHESTHAYLIPLENVFRFGVPKGSSFLERIGQDPSYAVELGLTLPVCEGTWLPFPIVEFFTKLEPTDRYLPLETALNFSGLLTDEFTQLMQMTVLTAIFLYDLLREKGLELWDGKLEFIKTGRGLLLADSITPDELRLTLDGTQLSKELLRQYYKNEDKAFCEAISKAKSSMQGSRGSLRALVQKRFGTKPRVLNPEFRGVIEMLYRSLAARITGLDIFGDTMDLQDILHMLTRWDVA